MELIIPKSLEMFLKISRRQFDKSNANIYKANFIMNHFKHSCMIQLRRQIVNQSLARRDQYVNKPIQFSNTMSFSKLM